MDSEFDPMSLVETALESSDKPESESCAEGKEGEAKKSLLETALESSDKPESFVEEKKEEAKKSVDSKKNGHVEEPETICLSSDEELDTDKRTKVILSRLPKSLTVIRGRTDDVTVLEEKLTTKTKRSLEHKQESSKSELEIDDPEEWDDLILMLRKSLKEDLDLKILDALVKRYQKLRSHLVASVRFLEVLRRTAKEVEEERDVNKVINHIGGLVENMKSIVKETKHYSGTVHCSDSKASMMASNISSSPATWIPAEEIRRSLAVANRKKKIQTLETALEKIQHELKKMDDAEVDFDDETNSTFLMSGRLEAKAAKIYKKLCELNGAVSDCGRPTLIKYKCKDTTYESISRRLEKLVNRTRECPEYMDVYKIVEEANKEESLGITDDDVPKIARRLFEIVVKDLQERRQKEYRERLWYWCGDDVEKEIKKQVEEEKNNPELRATLDKNQKMANIKMEELFDEFVKKQEGLATRGEEDVASSDESSEDEEGKGDPTEVESIPGGESSSCVGTEVEEIEDDDENESEEEDGSEEEEEESDSSGIEEVWRGPVDWKRYDDDLFDDPRGQREMGEPSGQQREKSSSFQNDPLGEQPKEDTGNKERDSNGQEEVAIHEEGKSKDQEEVTIHKEGKSKDQEEVAIHKEGKSKDQEEVEVHEEGKSNGQEEVELHKEGKSKDQEAVAIHKEGKSNDQEKVAVDEEGKSKDQEAVAIHKEGNSNDQEKEVAGQGVHTTKGNSIDEHEEPTTKRKLSDEDNDLENNTPSKKLRGEEEGRSQDAIGIDLEDQELIDAINAVS